MKKVKGNLLKMFDDGDFQVIIHGCNCFHTMGAGIALQIANQYPEAYEADKTTELGDEEKLGTYSHACINNNSYIINAYTQHGTGGDRAVSYDAIADVFKRLSGFDKKVKIGIPMIGAGLAGGDWDIIELIIDKAMPNHDITLVEWDNT